MCAPGLSSSSRDIHRRGSNDPGYQGVVTVEGQRSSGYSLEGRGGSKASSQADVLGANVYPARYLALFPTFPSLPQAFVAMSFDPSFQSRWESTLKPGIEAAGLKALRIDANFVSDSILTEILDGISRSKLVIVDITTMPGGFRNANVMYELGIAHATRLPEEVIILRSDADPLPFDTSQFRVLTLPSTEDESAGRDFVTAACIGATDAIEDARRISVREVGASLSAMDFEGLLDAMADGGFRHPKLTTVGQLVGGTEKASAISRLLQLGLIERSLFPHFTTLDLSAQVADYFVYKPSEFGKAVAYALLDELGGVEALRSAAKGRVTQKEMNSAATRVTGSGAIRRLGPDSVCRRVRAVLAKKRKW